MRNKFDTETRICPICNRREATFTQIKKDDYGAIWILLTKCIGCGSYEIDNGYHAHEIKLDENERVILSGLIRHYNDEVGKPYPLDALQQYKTNVLSIRPPADVIETIDLFLGHIGKRAPYFGKFTRSENEQTWKARLYLPKSESFATFAKVLQDEEYIYSRGTEFALTLKGWQRLREIRTDRKFSTQVFVAMWFHPELDSIYTDGFFPALNDLGFKPFRVDKHPNENRIDYEIMAQIRSSRLVVVDVTGERTGVYYEAGFAQGLGIPVVWTCNGSWRTKLLEMAHPNSSNEPIIKDYKWTERLHFDTRQFNHIFWNDAQDLRKQLSETIVGRGLNLK